MKSIWKEMNSYGTVLRSEYISLKFNHMLETLQHLKFMILCHKQHKFSVIFVYNK